MANGDNAFVHDSVSSGQLQPLNTCVRANDHLNHRKGRWTAAGAPSDNSTCAAEESKSRPPSELRLIRIVGDAIQTVSMVRVRVALLASISLIMSQGRWRAALVLLARLAAYISLEICSRSLNAFLAPKLADSGPLVEDWTFDSLRIRCGALFKTDRAAGENKDMTKWIEKYLGVGEWVMDQSVAIAGSSGWFERRR
ncbi:hypothetical protein SGCOL_003500 [Colletotrichum sp. CLE4]